MTTCPECLELAFPCAECRHKMKGEKHKINMAVQLVCETLKDTRESITLPGEIEQSMIELANSLVMWKNEND